jgi:hypothetical protein
MGVKNSRERYVYVGLRVPKRRPTNPLRDERGIGVYEISVCNSVCIQPLLPGGWRDKTGRAG